MIDSITRITLNLQETNTMVSIRAKRGDTGRKLLIHLSDGSIPYHISDDCYATFTAKKPDGTKINNACTIENNVIEYEFTEQTCTAVGTMKAEIRLYGADAKMITSACFLVNVYDTVFRDGDEVGSETEMNTLDDLILRANAFLNETGKLLRWQGNWDSETEYEANDLVLHEEVLYVAEEAIAAGTAPGSEGTAWVPIAGMGTGSGGEVVGIASVKQTYTAGSGGVNIVTVKLTDGTESEIKIRNGIPGASIQGPQGERGPMGPQGPAGPAGDDYVLTDADKAEIAEMAAGMVEVPDSGGNANQGTGLTSTEKNLMLTLFKAVPYISDVSATMKSLEAIWNSSSGGDDSGGGEGVTNYTIAYNLTNVKADYSATSIVEGGSLTVNLTPGTNAVLGEVVVTMGGVDVTATAYSNGQISISSVTGNVVITATADVAKYTQVEYIESIGTGSGNAGHINTGYVPAATDVVEVDFASTKTSWDYIFSCYGGGYYGIRNRLNGAYTTFTRGTGNNITFADPDPNFIPVSGVMYSLVETEPGVATIADPDGNVVANLRDANAVNITAFSNPIFLFCNSNGSSPYGRTSEPGVRIGKFRVKDVYGAVKLDLISVLDENNVACMYDKVSGEYLYNANTVEGSAFIAGGAV